MVLTSKWDRIQQKIQIWADHFVAGSWTVVRSPWKWEKMFIQLISATGPSSPVVHCTTPYIGKLSWNDWNNRNHLNTRMIILIDLIVELVCGVPEFLARMCPSVRCCLATGAVCWAGARCCCLINNNVRHLHWRFWPLILLPQLCLFLVHFVVFIQLLWFS